MKDLIIKKGRYLSPLRYPGGKSRQSKMIADFFPDDMETFYEPFVGGGSVFLELKNQGKITGRTFINDHNMDVALFWFRAQHMNKVFYLTYEKILKEKKEFGADFIKEKYFTDKPEVDFFLKNKMSFNGVGTFSKQACERNFNESSLERYKNLPLLMDEAYINDMDWKGVIPYIKSGCYVYLDPPYPTASKPLYQGHTGFDHEALANILKMLNKRGVYWVLSYGDDERIREMYKDFNIYDREWSYSMTNNSKNNKVKLGKELVITNFVV